MFRLNRAYYHFQYFVLSNRTLAELPHLREAAVRTEHGACDVRSAATVGEEEQRAGHLPGLRDALERDRAVDGRPRLEPLRVVGAEVLLVVVAQHLRVDEPGVEQVDADALRRVLDGRLPSEPLRGELTRSVPGGSVRGERANLTRLVIGCIEAKICKNICVGKLSPRSTKCTPLHRFGIESPKKLIFLFENR